MTLRDFPGHEVRKLLKGHRPQIPLVPVADGDGAVFRLPLAEHQHVGNAVQAGVADFGADFIRRFVHRDAHSPRGQGGAMRGGHVRHLVGDGQHAPKCSIRSPVKRSMEPKGARCTITGRCGLLSAPV